MNERRAELIYGQVLQRMDMTKETGDEELQELIRMTLEEASEKEYLPLNEKIELSRELFHAFRKLDILQELLEDPKITEIMVNGTDHIFYEKGGRLFRSERKFTCFPQLLSICLSLITKRIIFSCKDKGFRQIFKIFFNNRGKIWIISI